MLHSAPLIKSYARNPLKLWPHTKAITVCSQTCGVQRSPEQSPCPPCCHNDGILGPGWSSGLSSPQFYSGLAWCLKHIKHTHYHWSLWNNIQMKRVHMSTAAAVWLMTDHWTHCRCCCLSSMFSLPLTQRQKTCRVFCLLNATHWMNSTINTDDCSKGHNSNDISVEH